MYDKELLRLKMLRAFEDKKSKRVKISVEFYVENDPRAHYETIYSYLED